MKKLNDILTFLFRKESKNYVALFVLLFTLGVGNAWGASDMAKYGCKPVTGGQYYLYTELGYFFNTPAILKASGTNACINGSSTDGAILFTIGNVIDNESDGNTYAFDGSGTTTFDGISFQSGNKTYYLWPCITLASDKPSWLSRTSPVKWKIVQAAHNATYYPNTDGYAAYYMRGGLHKSGTIKPYQDTVYYAIADKGSGSSVNNIGRLAQTTSTASQAMFTTTGNVLKAPWLFISPEAYADATATTQRYYTVSTQVYTNGSESSDGGVLGVVPKTYGKPDVSDWANNSYASSIAIRQKGKVGDSEPIVTIFAKVTPTDESYNFDGFTDGTGAALTESSTIAAGNYYEIDTGNHIYRVSFAASGTDADHPSIFTLRACFSQASEPTVNVYHNEVATGYPTFAAALDAAEAGDRIELLADVENVSSTIALSKNITLDFNRHKIKSAATGAPTNLVVVTGNVTFTDNSLYTLGGITSTGAVAVYVNGGTLTINEGIFDAATYAVQRNAGTVTINRGGFEGATNDVNGTITLNGGFFVHNEGLSLQDGYSAVSDIPTGMKYSADDYNYMVVAHSSPNYPLCIVITKEKVQLQATYTYNILSRQNFNTLEAAIAYTNNNPNEEDIYKDILMREDYTLSPGNYTILDGTTLVIPYSEEQTMAKPVIDRTMNTDAIPTTAYSTLTLADGVHLNVYGAIEVGGVQTAGTLNATSISRPGGNSYGLMLMNGSSSITLYNGAIFYAWGFVQGEGTIDVRRGATVKEQFQINDWKTLGPTCAMAKGTGSGGSVNYQLHVLPINQYFIQNVEVATTYRPGSHLTGQVCANGLALLTIPFNDVGIIGVKYSEAAHLANPSLKDDKAIFLMDDDDDSEDTWVRKSYDVAHDTQLYEVNNAAYLGSLSMYVDFSSNPQITDIIAQIGYSGVDHLDVDSKDFALALSNNFKIHLLQGNLTVTQNTVMLPGMVMEVNKKSTLTIAPRVWDEDHKRWDNTPQTLSLYDYHQWSTYAAAGTNNSDVQWAYATHIKFRPNGTPDNTVRDISSAEKLGNARLIVHGTVDVQGYLNTTVGDWESYIEGANLGSSIKSHTTTLNDPVKEGGSSIISTIEDAGTIIYSRAAKAEKTTTPFIYDDFLWQTVFTNTTSQSEPNYEGRHVIPALLKNEDGSFVHSANTAAGQSFCFIDFDEDGKGEWMCLTDEGCFVHDQNNVYYIKPQAYIPISVGTPVAEADHTYRDHYAGTNKIYILMDGCQWWEVTETATPGIFHCEHPEHNTYFYWNGTKWAEKRYNVTFQTYDGYTLTYIDKNGVEQNHYELTYGTTPEWLGDIPARQDDNSYTYEFAGWTPTPVPVTEDAVYTAKYTATPRMYTITFRDQANNLIENQYLTWGADPACASYTLSDNEQWTPAIGIVAGDATYTVAPKKADNFTIRFVNYDGTLLDEQTNVTSGTTAAAILAAYGGGTPTKDAIDDEEYTFNGWSPAVVDATADATYTATFTASKPTYTIKFYEEDETTQIGTDQSVEYGVMPVIPDYSKDATAEKTYTLVWSPLVSAATANQNYIATFTEKTRQYRVDWKDGDNNIIETKYVDYGATPVYSGITPTKSSDATYAYTFTGWDRDFETVESDQVYTAQFNPVQLAMDVPDPQTITSSVSVQTITIETTGTLTVNPGAIVTADALILESNGSNASGQMIIPSSNSIHATNVYFDLKLNTEARHWHAFGVPWTIGNLDDVKLIADGQPMTLGRDYEIIYYNGATRASQGAGAHCWEYVTDHGKTLTPGLGYMIAFGRAVNTIRFTKATGTPILFNGSVALAANTGDADNGGWNAMANPKAFHAAMASGPTVGYVHNGGEIGSDGYDVYDLAAKKFIVGKMVYVQAAGEQHIEFNASSATPISPAPAPARRTNTGRLTDKRYLSLSDYYQVGIADANAEGGSVYVLPEEEKEDKYVIGHDLSHLGISDRKAQIWVFRYGTKLALNTTAPVDGVADYALRVYAPKNGEYTITNIQSPMSDEEYVLYLTRDGEAIWNLSDGAYTAELTAGVHKEYGLRLSARKSPAVVTGMDEAVVDAKGETRKVLINNQVFIIRGENVYSIDGQLVK